MEPRNQFSQDGQEVEQSDYQQGWDNAAFADDHVFAELLRLCPLSPGGGQVPARGIMPWGFSGNRDSGDLLQTALVSPNGAHGNVVIMPFRAFVGSRTLESVDARKNFREMRSALSLASGSTALATPVSFAANASGNPRWDLIVAAVSIDSNYQTVTRYVKDTTDDDANPETVVTQVLTTVTLQVVTGTTAANPVPPAVPADTSNVYCIPLAYVRIPTGFGASSTVLTTDIATVAPLVGLHASANGALNGIAPNDAAISTLLSDFMNAGWKEWGSSGTRPPSFVPSTMRGGFEKMIVAHLNPLGGGVANYGSGDYVDSSLDWRRRLFRWSAFFSISHKFPWETGATNGGMFGGIPDDEGASLRDTPKDGSAQSLVADSLVSGGPTPSSLLFTTGTSFTSMPGGNSIQFGVDQTTGQLFVYWSGGIPTDSRIILFVKATGQFENV